MLSSLNMLSVSENASLILGSENLVTPPSHAAEVTPDPCTPDTFKSPLDFSTVTVEQLGITPESFVKNRSGKRSHSVEVLLKFKSNFNTLILFTYPMDLITLHV